MNEYLKKYSHNFNSILGFKPTGWTCSGSICSLSAIKPQTSGQVTIYGEAAGLLDNVCYSLMFQLVRYIVNYQQVYKNL